MSKVVKDLITNEYTDRYRDVESACVVSVLGLDGNSANAFRGELRSKNLQLRLVKNSLARRAFKGSPLEPLADAFDGPCALVTGDSSAIDTAKTLVEAKKKYPALELKIGILEGDPEVLEVERMAQMKGRLELIGEIAMLMASPGRSIAGALSGAGGRIAGCLKTIADKEN